MAVNAKSVLVLPYIENKKENRMFLSKAGIKKVEISAKIIRADGSIEDLGVIARKESFWEMVKRKLRGK